MPAESRGLRGMGQEDVFRLHGVLQRALGQAPGVHDVVPPAWSGLVAEALQLAERGLTPRSQFLQDVWVLRATGHLEGGFFVEVGAGDGLYLSNTHLLETGFGWRGRSASRTPPRRRRSRALGRPRAVLLEHAVGAESGQTVHLTDSAERSAVTDGGHARRHDRSRPQRPSSGPVPPPSWTT